MINKKLIAFLLSIFIITIIFVVSILYTSNSNINSLIDGNQELLSEFKIKSNLQELIVDLTFISTEERKMINQNIRHGREKIDDRIKKVFNDLAYLKNIATSEDTRQKLNELENTIGSMMGHYNVALDTFYKNPRAKPEDLLAHSKADTLANKILALSNYLTTSRDKYLIGLIESADKNARRAKISVAILALIAIISSIYTLVYIIKKIRKQSDLISRLNESEKKVRDAATMKENFMANMSHEIRTPMNAILGFTNLLQKESLNNKSKEFVQSIQHSGENLLSIINDVLDFSKIEAGMMRIESSPFSLRGLMHSVETMFAERVQAKHLTLKVSVADGIPDVLNGDVVRLTQIMVNLINNSVKFTQTGSIDINVTATSDSMDKLLLSVTISDTGIGIPPDKLETIFERFQQADEDTTRKYGGTGLGLSIVKQLVELQQGQIRVISELNRGTEFTFSIPYEISRQVNNHYTPVSEPVDPKMINSEAINILVAEDNIMNQNLVKHLLSSWHLAFHLVNNGQEAMEALRQKKYSLVLMDIQMPLMDGYTTAQKIRRELKSNIPVIAMTAHAMAGEREKCLSYGMNEYISKPIRETELFNIIQRLLGDKEQEAIIAAKEATTPGHQYEVLDLQYLQELSGGNRDFEIDMIEQFLQQVPGELTRLAEAHQSGDAAVTAQVAHNLKTSVSFMGLLEQLTEPLEFIEQHAATPQDHTQLQNSIAQVTTTCEKALPEARQYLRQNA